MTEQVRDRGNSRARNLLRAAFVLVAAAFLVRAMVDAWRDVGGARLLPDWWSVAGAVALWCGGLLVAGRTWAGLLSTTRCREHAAGFFVSQLGKYVPGSVWQAAGQVGLARQEGVDLGRAGTTFAVFAVTQAVAGATLTLGLMAAPGVPGAARVASAGGLVLTVLLDRRWMLAVVRRIHRLEDRAPDLIPPQGAILRAWGVNLVSLATHCLAFAVVLTAIAPGPSVWSAASAQAAAWTLGFLVFPVPAGLGVRELVLVGLLPGVEPASLVVTASVVHRLASMVAEALLAAGGLVWLRRRREPEAADD